MLVLQTLIPNFEIQKQFVKYLEKAGNVGSFLLSPIKSQGMSINYIDIDNGDITLSNQAPVILGSTGTRRQEQRGMANFKTLQQTNILNSKVFKGIKIVQEFRESRDYNGWMGQKCYNCYSSKAFGRQEGSLTNKWHCRQNRRGAHIGGMRPPPKHREGGVGGRGYFKSIESRDATGLHSKDWLSLEICT